VPGAPKIPFAGTGKAGRAPCQAGAGFDGFPDWPGVPGEDAVGVILFVPAF